MSAIEAVLAALAVPPAARLERRIAKATLNEQMPTPALKRLVRDAVTRLDWVGELSPTTIGVRASDDPPAPAINLLVLTPARPPTQRLWEAIHRLIPAPVLLLTATADGGVTITLAPLRQAERMEGVVLERLVVTPTLDETPDAEGRAFLASLELSTLPRTDLRALYEGLVVRAEALAVARAIPAPFRLPAGAFQAAARRAALADWRSATVAWEAARATARREKRLVDAVRLGEKAAEAKRALERAKVALSTMGD